MPARTRTLLEWTDLSGANGMIEIDVTKTRGFEIVAEVTEFPVETGTAVTDHIRPMNGTVTLEGLVSNTPIVVPATQMRGITRSPASVTLRDGVASTRATVMRFSRAFDRVQMVDGLLRALIESATVVRLVTSLRTLEDLAITRYQVSQDADTGQALPIVLELKQLRIVTTARAPVPAVRRMQVPQQRGVQTTDNRSTLARILDGGAPATAARHSAGAP